MLRKGCSIVLQLLLLVMGAGTTAQSVSELLEKGIYEEETVGDLDAAIEIYDRIVNDAEADRPFVARALFRRAQCFLKAGNEEEATRSFRKLVAEYPDQAELAAQARKHLPEKTEAGLALEAAPWEDGEHLRFVLKARSGEPIGDVTYSVRSVRAGGVDAWRMESYLGIPKAEIAKYSMAEFRRDNSLPFRTMLYHSQLGTLRAEYDGEWRRIRMNEPGGETEPYDQKLAAPTYDNEQAIHLVRRLPLAEGYETQILFTGRPGVTAMAGVRVTAIETVTVPAGTFECFKVELGSPPRIETQWISTGDRRRLVKVGTPEISLELTEITRLSPGGARYSDDRAGISLAAPSDWDIMKSAFRFGEHEFLLLLLCPEFKVKGVLLAQKLEDTVTVREFAEIDLDIYRNRRSSYAVREDTWEEREIAGAPAVSVLADLEAEGAAVVERRIYIQGPSAFYWFVFRAEPDVLDSMNDDLDFIVDSLAFR